MNGVGLGLAGDAPRVPGPIGRAVRNAGWLLGGKGVGALFSLVYLALAARSLGVEQFGIFALVLSYGQAVTNVVQFQSWQTVIRYGAVHIANAHPQMLERVLGFTALLDLGASLAGALLAAAGVALVGDSLGWSPEQQHMAALFGMSLVFGLRGTPTGVLRLFDRFDLAAYSETVLPAMRLVGALAAWSSGASVAGYLIAWAVAELVTTVAMWFVAWRELGRRGIVIGRRLRVTGVTRENPGLWRFAWTTNLTSSINLMWQQVPVLAVGWVVGPGAAGGYRMAAQLASALNKPIVSLARAIYPEFAKLAVDSPAQLRAAVLRSTMIASATGVGAVILVATVGYAALGLIGGPAYTFAFPFLLLLSIAAAIDLCGFGLEPAMVAIGRPGLVLAARAGTSIVYAALMLVLLHAAGAIGAAIAAVCASAVLLGLLAILSLRQIRAMRGA